MQYVDMIAKLWYQPWPYKVALIVVTLSVIVSTVIAAMIAWEWWMLSRENKARRAHSILL